MGTRDRTVYAHLKMNAVKTGSELAIIDSDRSITHAEFLERADRLAAGLVSKGIQKGDRICILAQNSIEYFDLYGACAKIGAIAYPINWRLSTEEVVQVFRLADPQMLAVGSMYVSVVEGLDLGTLRATVLMEPGSADGFTPIADLYIEGDDAAHKVDADDPFVIISTAATAAVPRGAILTHGNMLTAGEITIEALGLSSSDRHLAALPLFHITGLGLSLAVAQAGGANVVTEAFDPALSAQMIDQHAVSLIASFPPVLTMLLEARQASGAQWESLRFVMGLDAPDTIQRLLTETKAQFWTGFGQSETSGVVTMTNVMERPGSAGRAVPGVEVVCLNEMGEEVPAGETGEIAVRGPLVFAGYWRDPDATDYASRHGWHHTGDLGKFDADGYLYYVGRKPEKELIKSGGENVYPAEVERIIQELPEIAAVCVIGVPDEKWGEAVKAVVELVPGEKISDLQLADAVASRIAAFKKPRYVDFVEKLPRTPDGDVDRAAVKADHGG
jgi:acyl-CoA synthetase (AMP-forming)/AMP-acid ligase II